MLSIEERRKRMLRKLAMQRRDKLTREQIAAKSHAIAQRVLALQIWRDAYVVMGYCAFNSEVRTDELLNTALQQGKRIVLPRVCLQRRELDLYYIDGLTDEWLELSKWGIREPKPDRCHPAQLADIDLILVPGVAFDTFGGRIGYGGGYYDRLLARLTPDQQRCVIGLAFEEQIVLDVPLNFFDFRVPLIVTDKRLIRTGA